MNPATEIPCAGASLSHTALRVMEIERFAIHDGPGIRSVIFLQGCPLHCPWCANPESQTAAPVLMHLQKNCIGCGLCAASCPKHAITFKNKLFSIDRNRCAGCMTCENLCPEKAIHFSSHIMSITEILSVVSRDDAYYEESSGGITISGGEAFLQFGMLMPLLQALKERGYHLCMETSGQAPLHQIQAASPLVDCFLFDIKHVDESILRQATGGELSLILKNLHFLCETVPQKVILRVPVIPGFNYTEEVLHRTADLAQSLLVREIHYLPFHTLGKSKYEQLGLPYAYGGLKMLTKQDLEPFAAYAKSLGLTVHIGG